MITSNDFLLAMLLRLGRINQGDMVKCRRLFAKLDRYLFPCCSVTRQQPHAQYLTRVRRICTKMCACAHPRAAVDRARDTSGALDDNDIASLLQEKPNTSKLGDHEFNPTDHDVFDDSDKPSDRNLKLKRVRSKDTVKIAESPNPTFQSDNL